MWLPYMWSIWQKISESINTFIVFFHNYYRYKVEISGGLGAQAGKIWRVGIMGYNATTENVSSVLRALSDSLRNAGYKAKLWSDFCVFLMLKGKYQDLLSLSSFPI